MENKEKKKILGPGSKWLLGITISFIVLKLFEIITWSWWLVLMPLWILFFLTILLFGIGTIFLLVEYYIIARDKKDDEQLN